jgi:hypothetical protein
MIPKYESHHPVCLDVEWLLPTLFDASLLTFEPPLAALFLSARSPRIGQKSGNHLSDHSDAIALRQIIVLALDRARDNLAPAGRSTPVDAPALLSPQRFSLVKVNGTLPASETMIGAILATSATISVTRSRGARVCADGRHQ